MCYQDISSNAIGTMWYKFVLVFQKEKFQLHLPAQWHEMKENENIFLSIPINLVC